MSKEITTVEEAVIFLQEKAGINVEEIKHKWKVWDLDFDDYIHDDKELIEYANEQKEAIEK